jgi:hypothetical protein
MPELCRRGKGLASGVRRGRPGATAGRIPAMSRFLIVLGRRLPGDIVPARDGFRLYVAITASPLIGVLPSVLVWRSGR